MFVRTEIVVNAATHRDYGIKGFLCSQRQILLYYVYQYAISEGLKIPGGVPI